MKSYTIATKQVPAVWLEETKGGVIYHNDNDPKYYEFETWQEAIQKTIDDCGVLGDLEYAIRDLGPWQIGHGSEYSWSIVNGSRIVKIGPVDGRTNYFDCAMKECVKRNAKVHSIRLPAGY